MQKPKSTNGISSAIVYALLVVSAIAASLELGFSRSVTPGLIVRYAARFGPEARGRLEGWKEFVRVTAGRAGQARGGSGEVELLGPVNAFFNGIPSGDDRALWGVEDYWATPSESLSIYRADCEDYAIAKYFTLKELGVPIARLRMVYAKTWRSPSGHMVLAYYPDPRADPLILDNLTGSIERASSRPDLTPVYTFNDDDLMFPRNDAMGTQLSGSSVRQWRNLTEKLERELTY